ncbi:hypothetical protein DL767_001162 [Monosporascus sp. MG133]|nr:hypothetical protein DL767_001162 [Monosporascus sp. MG133]
MKVSVYLVALSNILLVSAVPAEAKKGDVSATTVDGAVSLPDGVFKSSVGAAAWCGGFTEGQCSYLCGALGYPYYYCDANYCNCLF